MIRMGVETGPSQAPPEQTKRPGPCRLCPRPSEVSAPRLLPHCSLPVRLLQGPAGSLCTTLCKAFSVCALVSAACLPRTG